MKLSVELTWRFLDVKQQDLMELPDIFGKKYTTTNTSVYYDNIKSSISTWTNFLCQGITYQL